MIEAQPRQPPRSKTPFVPVAAGVLGGLAMALCLGPSIVDPTAFEWLMHGDYALHFFGWHLYRHGPWTWPLGATPQLLSPIGSSVGLTDAIPIVAIPLKLLDPFLPPIFQFIGAWLVLSVALQAVFGVLLMRLATPRRSLQLLGAALFVLSPPLIYRINHAALTAHWEVLAALWLSLREDADMPSWRLAAAWATLCAVTAATQPYLLLMIVVLMLAAHATQALVAPRRLLRVGLHAAIALGAAWAALWQSGSLMIRSDEGLDVGGFGAWSSNLLTFVMPTEAHTLLSPGFFPYEHREQYEGYAYLGLGILLLAAIVSVARATSVVSWVFSRRAMRRLPLALALLFLTVMAFGPKVTAGPYTLFTYDRSWWGPLIVFRTNGRMIWPLFYTVIFAVLFGATRLPYRRALILCAMAVVVQMVDVAGSTRYIADLRTFGFRDPLVNPFWTTALPHYERLVLIPPNLCAREGYLDFVPFTLRAGLHDIGINTGMTARFDVRKGRQYCLDLQRELKEGIRPGRSLYVVRPDLLSGIAKPATDPPMCTVVDGYGVCFSTESYGRWRDALDLPRSRLPETAEFLRFYDELNEVYRTVLLREPREADGSIEAHVDGIVRYLSLRMEGCDHVEAERRTLHAVEGRGLCPALPHLALPPADQTFAFAQRLGERLAETRGTAGRRTHVDAEGEAVWLQAYAMERARGAREQDAREAVLAAIRGAK